MKSKQFQQRPIPQTIENIAFLHISAPSGQKRKWLSLVVDDFTAEELHDQEFQFSKSALANARRHTQQYVAEADVPNPQQPPSKRRKSANLHEN